MKKNLSFWAGAAAGAILGAATLKFLSSEKGQKIQKDTREKLHNFYEYIQPRLKNMKNSGQKEFSDFIESAAKDYTKMKNFSEKESKDFIKKAKKVLKNAKEEYSEEEK